MSRYFPPAAVVVEARSSLANGHYADIDALMHVEALEIPYDADLPDLIDEFLALTEELGFGTAEDAGFVVLVPVTINGVSHTTPVLVDMRYRELCFTSHPELGAGAIPDEVLVENVRLVSSVRSELLGVLATWHNAEVAEAE